MTFQGQIDEQKSLDKAKKARKWVPFPNTRAYVQETQVRK